MESEKTPYLGPERSQGLLGSIEYNVADIVAVKVIIFGDIFGTLSHIKTNHYGARDLSTSKWVTTNMPVHKAGHSNKRKRSSLFIDDRAWLEGLLYVFLKKRTTTQFALLLIHDDSSFMLLCMIWGCRDS
jgi:hypothetical protein